MSYIFSDLKTKLATQIGDPNLDSTVMGDALNYTQQSVFNTFDLTLNSAQQTNAIASGASTLTSAMPTDYQRMYSLYITSPTALAADITDYFLDPKDFRKRFPSIYNTGTPREWTYFTTIEFSTLANTDYVIKLDYIKSIALMSADSDVPVIPQAFEELLLLGAKIRVFEQKEDFDYANQFSNRYADQLEAFVTRYSVRQVDNQVVIPGSRWRATPGV